MLLIEMLMKRRGRIMIGNRGQLKIPPPQKKNRQNMKEDEELLNIRKINAGRLRWGHNFFKNFWKSEIAKDAGQKKNRKKNGEAEEK